MDENAIRNLFKEFETAFNRHDPNGIASCWTEDCDHIDPDGAEAKGRAEMQRLTTEKHNSVFRGSNIKVHIQRIRELSPDIVQVDGTWELSNARTPDGRTIGTMPGKVLCLCKREGDQWRMYITRPFVPLGALGEHRAAA